MSDANKAVVRRVYSEMVNGKNLDLAGELVAEDFVDHESFPGLPNTGTEAVRAVFEMLLAAFPDMQMTVEDMIAEGNKVATRITISGTHDGDFMGSPPTNKTFAVEAIEFFELSEGKLVAHWGVTDQAAMMGQLGLTP